MRCESCNDDSSLALLSRARRAPSATMSSATTHGGVLLHRRRGAVGHAGARWDELLRDSRLLCARRLLKIDVPLAGERVTAV